MTGAAAGSVLLATTRSVPGGAQRTLASLASALEALGWQVEVALAEPGWLADELGERGIAAQVGEVATVDPARHDALVSLGASGHAWAGPAAVATGVPACWWLELGLRGRPAERAALSLGAAAIAAPTAAAARSLRELAPDADVRVIPPGVEVGDVDAAAAAAPALRARRPDGERLVVLVGRLDPIKGQDVAIEALALLRSAGWPVRLALVGGAIVGHEGDLVERLHARAAALEVAEHVEWVGHVADTGPWFAAADVAIAPSLHEAFGLSVVEALAQGTPVVASATDGPSEILDGGAHGLLVPPGDGPALAGAIGRILDDAALAADLAHGAPARAAVYGSSVAGQRWGRLLAEVLEGRGAVSHVR